MNTLSEIVHFLPIFVPVLGAILIGIGISLGLDPEQIEEEEIAIEEIEDYTL